MRVLSIIPARIGSKGIPEKNLSKIGDLTLVERALFTAIKTEVIDDIIVSTDSQRIRHSVNNYGNYAPFTRPNDLATDTAGSLEVIKHGLSWAENVNNCKYDFIVLLEPPSPFRLPLHIEKGIEIAKKNAATSVVSLVSVGDYHPIRMKTMDDQGRLKGVMEPEPDGLRRQDQTDVYIRNCGVYVFDTKTIRLNKLWGDNPFGFKMNEKFYAINIDEPNDLYLARAFYEQMINQDLGHKIEVKI